MRKLSRPYFISLEGVEGAGKTSQLANIIDFFTKKDISVIATREPGGTELADRIRKILVEPQREALDPLSELLLYNAARVQHLRDVIRPALAEGQSVICDRFTDATIAYQAYGRELPLGQVKQICDWATDGLEPDLTFLLDCPPAEGLARSRQRLAAEGSEEGRFEEEALAFHERVRQGYLEIAARQKDRMHVIDATQEPATVSEQLRKVLNDRIG